MAKKSPQVDVYIAKSADFAKPILNHLRQIVHSNCATVEESLKWRAPHFIYGGKILCGMAGFKQYCKFGFWHPGMKQRIADIEKSGSAWGLSGRITSLSDLPARAVIARLVKAAVQLEDDGIKREREKPKPKKAIKVPPDFRAALNKNETALAGFENQSPSHKREYFEWIVEAKRPETRTKRIQTALQWLSQGKSRNWKYERK